MRQNKLSRRHFIQLSGFAVGSIVLFSRCYRQQSESRWRFFTEKEASLTDAIVEQIIPTDEWDGAKAAGVTNYIDKQLVGPYLRFQEKYRKGLAAMVISCEELYKKQFGELSWDEQTAFLKKMESGELSGLLQSGSIRQEKQETTPWVDSLDQEFFGLVRNHTMQGFYGSPRHGGNKNYVSYRMVGLDYPFTIGQNRYKG